MEDTVNSRSPKDEDAPRLPAPRRVTSIVRVSQHLLHDTASDIT